MPLAAVANKSEPSVGGAKGSWAAEPWSKIVAISRSLSSRIQLTAIQVGYLRNLYVLLQ